MMHGSWRKLCGASSGIAFALLVAGSAPCQQYGNAQPPAAPPAPPRSAYAAQPQPSAPPAQYQQPVQQQQPAQFQQPAPYQQQVPPSQSAPNYQGQPAQAPAGGYPQQAPVNIQPYAAQPNGGAVYANTVSTGQPAQPIRLVQQPNAGQSPNDMAPAGDMSSGAGGGAAGGTEVAAGSIPIELNEHLRSATEHPLMPALRWATTELENIRAIKDYSCFFYKRERIDGQLGGYQAMYMKVRHEPFSVYLYFKAPSNLEGQEVIYVKGLNDGNLQAHTTGIKSVVGTVSLNPNGTMAMRGNRYPVTEAGILNLLDRLVAVGNKDVQYGECDVQFFTSAQGVKVGGRPCTCIQVTHPVPRRNFIFYQARIYVDEELHLPVRYESYDWPPQQGGQPLLMEEYTYQNLKLNNGFTDIDFDTRNPNYGFR